MAHGMMGRDRQWAKKTAWHGLTDNVEGEITYEATLGTYELVRVPLHMQLPDGAYAPFKTKDVLSPNADDRPALISVRNSKNAAKQIAQSLDANTPVILPVDDGSADDKIVQWSGIISTDDNQPVGNPIRGSYHFLTNRAFWDIAVDGLAKAGVKASVVSVLTMLDRSRRAISFEIEDATGFSVGKRKFAQYFNVSDSVNGTTRLYVGNSITCIVCANTDRAFINEIENGDSAVAFSLKHTASLHSNVELIKLGIGANLAIVAQYQKALRAAHGYGISNQDALALFAAFLAGSKATETLSTRAMNTVAELGSLFTTGKGNAGETLLDAYSAITDFYTHSSAGSKNPVKQFISSEIGDGANKKSAFGDLIFLTEKGKFVGLNDKGIKEAIARGHKLLTETIAKSKA
jgi:Domain of unknown function (DUF932)